MRMVGRKNPAETVIKLKNPVTDGKYRQGYRKLVYKEIN